ARRAVPPREIVPDDAEVVERHVRILWASGAFANRPDVARAGLEAVVHAEIAARVQLDAGDLQPDPVGVGRASSRHEEVAALDASLTGPRAQGDPDAFSRPPFHPQHLRLPEHLDALVGEHSFECLADVRILSQGDLRAT